MHDTIKPIFIYFRYTPKELRFICSYDTTPKGERKILIRKDDPVFGFVTHIVNTLTMAVNQDGGHQRTKRPDFEAIVRHLTSARTARLGRSAHGMLQPVMIEMVSERRYSHMVYLKADATMSERIMIVPKGHINTAW